MSQSDIYEVIFDVSAALELPVVLLSLLALAMVLVETGAFLVESRRRFRRSLPALTRAVEAARGHVRAGDGSAAAKALAPVAWGSRMGRVLSVLAEHAADPAAEPRIAKELADFDFACQRRLARTRLLVRIGPALGLMGTLIPLSPALEGLAAGDVLALTENLRVAFSITVLGLLVGAAAFALSLARDRIYGQDYSDLEYAAAVLAGGDTGNPPAPAVPTSAPRAVS